MLTDNECNVLDKIASRTKMDCWFWIMEDGRIFDLENGVFLNTKTGVEQLLEGIEDSEVKQSIGLGENEMTILRNLMYKLCIPKGE